MSNTFSFRPSADFVLTSQHPALAGGFPVYSTDISPSGNPQTFDLVVTRTDTGAVVKSLLNQAYVLATNWFDTLQTDYQWTADTQGYNFRFRCVNATIFSVYAAVANVQYRFRFTARTATQGVWQWDHYGFCKEDAQD